MKDQSAVRTVVVLPARNEVARIGDCLRALAVQAGDDVAVVLVANNCTDGTEAAAQDCAAAAGLTLEVLSVTLPSRAGVGTARRMGCDHALALWPDLNTLLCTDSDCTPAPDWIARNRHHLECYDAVCGRVEPIASEWHVMKDMDIDLAQMEGRYEALVLAYYRRFNAGPHGLEGDHGNAAGASLALRVDAYRASGGFADLVTGEDRELVRCLKAARFAVLHAGDVRVAASCRLEGRAQDGMAAALRLRATRRDYLIDDALPHALHLIVAAENGTLGPWPLQVAPQDRLRACDLGPHIDVLEQLLDDDGCEQPFLTAHDRSAAVPAEIAIP